MCFAVPISVIIPNFGQIGRTVAEMAVFRLFKMTALRHGFIKMADTEGAQLGSLEKLVADGYI